jgi:hypothetical protein
VRMTSLEEPFKLRNGVTLMSTTTSVSRKAASQPDRNPFAHFPADDSDSHCRLSIGPFIHSKVWKWKQTRQTDK